MKQKQAIRRTGHRKWRRSWYGPVLLGLFLSALLFTLGTAEQAHADTPTLTTYRQLLRRAEFELRDINTADAADRKALLADIRKNLAAITAVQLPDGTVVTVSTASILEELNKPEPDLPLIISRLHLLNAYLDQASQTGAPPPQSVWDDLDQLLNQKKNDPFKWLRDAFSEAQAFVNTIIARLLELLFSTRLPGNTNLISVIAVILGVGLLGGAVWYFFRGYRKRLVQGAKTVEEEIAEEGDIFSSARASQKADEQSKSGDYSRALRLLLVAALLMLDEAGLFFFDHSLTNQEYLRMVRGRPEIQGPLREIVTSFEKVWYGGRQATETEYLRAKEALAALRLVAPKNQAVAGAGVAANPISMVGSAGQRRQA